MRPAELLARSGTNDPMEFIRIGIAAAKEGKYDRGLVFLAEAYNRLTRKADEKPTDGSGPVPTARAVPATALSYYGLCLALQRRYYREGAAFCELAISAERLVAEHYLNLARVWNESENKEKAMETVKRGLAVFPDNKPLLRLRNELSKSQRAVSPILTQLGAAVGRLFRR
jgi:tetratricopeptide (TPR) repeat protein